MADVASPAAVAASCEAGHHLKDRAGLLPVLGGPWPSAPGVHRQGRPRPCAAPGGDLSLHPKFSTHSPPNTKGCKREAGCGEAGREA